MTEDLNPDDVRSLISQVTSKPVAEEEQVEDFPIRVLSPKMDQQKEVTQGYAQKLEDDGFQSFAFQSFADMVQGASAGDIELTKIT